VNRQARKWAAAAALLALVAGGALAFGQLSGTFAIFTAETENPNAVLNGGWVNPATSLTVSNYGNGGSVTFTVGNTGTSPYGAITGDQIIVDVLGANGSCPATSSSYATTGSQVSGSPVSDAGSSGNATKYVCYGVRSYMNTWYADAFPSSAIQVGLIPTSFSTSPSGSHSGQTDDGDTINVNFNQAISSSVSGITVCVFTSASSTGGVILIGDTNNCAGTGDSVSIGKLTGLNIPTGGSNSNVKYGSSTASVINSGLTLHILLGGGGSGSGGRTNVSGTGTYTGTGSSVTSSSGGANQCTVSGCTPSATVSF
jgi:hypothetical protein